MISYGICLSLSDLTSLGVIISRSIHVAANGIISFFLWLSNIPLLWPPDSKNLLIRKERPFDAEKDCSQEEKEMKEDKMVGWPHRLNGHEFEQALGDSEGQGSLAHCSPWGHKESDTTEPLN